MLLKHLFCPNLLLLLNCSWIVLGLTPFDPQNSVGTEVKEVNFGRFRRQVATDQQGKSIRLQDTTVVERQERLQCYLCSWSVMGPGNASEFDICSTGNFERDEVPVVPCEHGCQTVSFRVSKKDEVRYFFRNCLKKEEGKEISGDKCYQVETVYGFEHRCECLSNLCNGSSSPMTFDTKSKLTSILNSFVVTLLAVQTFKFSTS